MAKREAILSHRSSSWHTFRAGIHHYSKRYRCYIQRRATVVHFSRDICSSCLRAGTIPNRDKAQICFLMFSSRGVSLNYEHTFPPLIIVTFLWRGNSPLTLLSNLSFRNDKLNFLYIYIYIYSLFDENKRIIFLKFFLFLCVVAKCNSRRFGSLTNS